MDQYSPAELTELYFLASSQMDVQFQFWVSITFAVLVAGYAAQDRFSRKLRFVGAVLYGLASFVLISRFIGSGLIASEFNEALSELGGSNLSSVAVPAIIARFLLFMGGSISAVYFLLRTGDSVNESRSVGGDQ